MSYLETVHPLDPVLRLETVLLGICVKQRNFLFIKYHSLLLCCRWGCGLGLGFVIGHSLISFSFDKNLVL
jgi:hypothetical protein